jgi:hypothetical protein
MIASGSKWQILGMRRVRPKAHAAETTTTAWPGACKQFSAAGAPSYSSSLRNVRKWHFCDIANYVNGGSLHAEPDIGERSQPRFLYEFAAQSAADHDWPMIRTKSETFHSGRRS